MVVRTHTLLAVPAAVSEARRAARAFAASHGASDSVVASVELAVSEACTNVVRHSGAPAVVVEFECEDDELRVHVVDHGRGLLAANGLDPGAGLGLPIISMLAKHVELRQPDGGGTDLEMAFVLAG